jgi:hypothetical protein
MGKLSSAFENAISSAAYPYGAMNSRVGNQFISELLDSTFEQILRKSASFVSRALQICKLLRASTCLIYNCYCMIVYKKKPAVSPLNKQNIETKESIYNKYVSHILL